MKTLLWIDDVRNPFVGDWLLEWAPEYYYGMDEGTHEVVWVKHYDGFVDLIQENGLPTEIGFDHDLADIAWGSEHGEEEKTGNSCVLCSKCKPSRKGKHYQVPRKRKEICINQLLISC